MDSRDLTLNQTAEMLTGGSNPSGLTKIMNDIVSQPMLDDFASFCYANPDLRFWQALARWSQFDVIVGENVSITERKQFDTFYMNEK